MNNNQDIQKGDTVQLAYVQGYIGKVIDIYTIAGVTKYEVRWRNGNVGRCNADDLKLLSTAKTIAA
jgi:hypothetical protein